MTDEMGWLRLQWKDSGESETYGTVFTVPGTEDDWRFQIEKTKKTGWFTKKSSEFMIQRKMQITENWKPWKRNILFQ